MVVSRKFPIQLTHEVSRSLDQNSLIPARQRPCVRASEYTPFWREKLVGCRKIPSKFAKRQKNLLYIVARGKTCTNAAKKMATEKESIRISAGVANSSNFRSNSVRIFNRSVVLGGLLLLTVISCCWCSRERLRLTFTSYFI